MAFSFGFYNSFEHDRRYNSLQISRIFDGIINDGIYATVEKAMILRVNELGQVVVQPGRGWFDHTWNYNDADLPLPTPESDLLLDRYDAVVIDIDSSNAQRKNDIIWVIGEPSSTPQKPNMIKTFEHTQYPLGYVYRKANSTEISQEDVKNAVGTEECPFVTGIIDTISIDELLLQWKDQWDQFMSRYEESAGQWIADRQKEYIDHFTKLYQDSSEYYDSYIGDIQDYYEDISSRGEEKYEEFKKIIEDYVKELETSGNATVASIVKQLLEFRDTNEGNFLTWLESVKEQMSQYPAGEILLEIEQLKEQQEEIIQMLATGYVIAQVLTDDGDYIIDDLGNPMLTGARICTCNNLEEE